MSERSTDDTGRPIRHPVESGQSQRADQKAETRSRIADAALAEFADKGFRAASIGAIAKRAHIARSTVHFHFQTKVDLANEIGFSLYPASRAMFVDLGTVDISQADDVRAWLHRVQSFMVQHSVRASVATQANMTEPSLGQDLVDILDGYAVEIVRALQKVENPSDRDVEMIRFLLIGLDRYNYLTEIQGVRMRDATEDAAVETIMWTLARVAARSGATPA